MKFALTGVAILVSTVGLGAQRGPLVMLVNIAEYFGDDYIDRSAPGADYVYFVGEPIRLDVQVLNVDGAEHTVVSQSPTAPSALSARATTNGQPTNVGVTISSELERHEDAFQIPVDWGSIRLNPRASLHWKAELARDLPPGVYMVDFALDLSDENARPPSPHGPRFRFEVREPSADSAAEVIKRRAVRALAEEHYDVAEAEAASLLRLHPNSFMAYSLLGRVAETQGRQSAAVAAFQRAIAIVKAGTDQLYRWSNPWQKNEVIDSLESDLARVTRR